MLLVHVVTDILWSRQLETLAHISLIHDLRSIITSYLTNMELPFALVPLSQRKKQEYT